MIQRLDHAVIAVRDLAAAADFYRVLGFGVENGGRHTGAGTCNAIVRFGLDYLELITVEDAEKASHTLRGAALTQFLRNRPQGPLGFALAATHLQELAGRLRNAGLPVTDPFGMERLRPDGRLMTWSLLVPGEVAWRRPWPFFIEWDTADAVRLSWEPPPQHPNGATGIAGVAIAVDDYEGAIDLYARQIGLTQRPGTSLASNGSRTAGFGLDGVHIDLIYPTSDGPVHEAVARDGPGLFEIVLRTRSLDVTLGALEGVGVQWEAVAGDPSSIRVLTDITGVRLTFASRG